MLCWRIDIPPQGFPALCCLSCRLESRCSWEIVVHAAPFAQLSPAALVQVAVVAPPRWLPHVKHTNWVSSRSSNIAVCSLVPIFITCSPVPVCGCVCMLLEPNVKTHCKQQCLAQAAAMKGATYESSFVCCRQQYADLVPSSAAEGILGTQNGELLEGFISNLFIVQDSNHGLVVRTAVEGVLAGTKQQQVLAACNTLGINIKCEAPIQTERHLWKEAFLTNAVRGLRPISHISCPPNNAIGWEPWTCQLSVPSSQSVYCRVQRHLLSNCQCESV